MKSIRVENALKKLGRDIKDARKRRRINTKLMAERLSITTDTLAKLEAGNPNVKMGSYALALHVLGKIDELEMIIDRTNDQFGLDLADEALPVRIHQKKEG